MFKIKRVSPSNTDFKQLVQELDKDLNERYVDYYEKFGKQNSLDVNTRVLLAFSENSLAGCAALRPMPDSNCIELKRMFVRKNFRKRGLSKMMLTELEQWADELGYAFMQLETGINQPEAISLYKTQGYVVTEPYGEYINIPECICLKKNITNRIQNLRIIPKPHPEEYPPYSEIYMSLIPDDGQVLKFLEENAIKLKKLIYSLPESTLYYRYAPGKWSVKEILVHLIDDERIFSYRALRYARNDSTPLHGFEENDYAKYSDADKRNLESIFSEYNAVRLSTIQLFQNLPEDSFMRTGSGIGDDGEIINNRTVRALAYHIAGHEQRHINIITERYIVD